MAVAIPTELDKIVGRQPTIPASTVLARSHSPYDGSKIRRDWMSSGAKNTRKTQSGNIVTNTPAHINPSSNTPSATNTP